MKKQGNNENQSIISTLFTEKELAELQFSEEEIESIEMAELISQSADVLPDSDAKLDEFFEKFDKMFPPSTDVEGTFKKFMNLQTTDPKFLEQIVAVSALIDTVEEFPPAATEKVSLEDIRKEQNAQLSDERKAKFAQIDAMLARMAEENKNKK